MKSADLISGSLFYSHGQRTKRHTGCIYRQVYKRLGKFVLKLWYL